MRTRRTVSRIRKKARFARIALLAAVLLLLGCVAVDSAAHLPCVKVLQTAADRLPNGPMGVKVWGLMIASGLLALFVFGPGKGKGESGVEFTDVYRCFFEENPSANIILGSDGIIKELNKSGSAALGYAERSQLIGRPILDLVTPEHKARLTQLLQESDQGSPGKAKVDLSATGSGVRTFLFCRCSAKYSDKEYPGALFAGMDVTDRRLASEHLPQPTQDLEFLSETAEGFLELSPQDDVHHYMGERLKQLVSEAAYIVVNSVDRQQRKLQVRCVLGGGKLVDLAVKAIGRDPAGMSFDVHDEAWQGLAGGRLVKIPGGIHELAFSQIPKAACSAIEKLANLGDIYVMGFAKKGEVYGSAAIVLRRGVQLTNQTVIETFIRQAGVALQRRQAEEALQREREKLELATENSGVGLAIISKDYRTLWANQVLKRMFGDVEGKSCYLTYNQRAEVCPECGVRELFQTGKDKVVHEQVGKDKEGKTIWSQIIVTPVRDTQGNLTAALEAVVPITERKQNEILQTVLYRIANAASTARDLEELFRIIRKELMSVLDTTNFFVALYDRETGSLSLPYHVDQKDKFSSFPPGRTLTAWILRNDSPLLCTPEVRKRLLEAGEIEPTGALSVAWLGVPLKVDSETIGVLGVQSYSDPSAYGTKELEILQFASEQIAVAIRRKQAEEALKRSERDYRGLFEGAHDAILIFEPETETVLDVNRRACEVYGFERLEFVGMSLERISQDVPKGKKHIQLTLEKGSYHRFQTVQYRKDGSRMLLEVNASVVDYMGQRVILSINRDVTERKQAEDVLEKEKERYRNLFETAPDSITTLDTLGFIVSCNVATERLAGYSPRELVGKHFTKLGVVRAKDLPRFLKLFGSIIRGKVPEPVEVAVLRKDGIIRQLETHISLLREDGKITGIQVISRDITERRRAAEALRSSEHRYRQLFQQNLAAVYQTTLDGTIADCNPSFARLLGYESVEQVLTKNASEFYFSQTDRQEFLSRLQKKGSLTDFEYRLRRRDGKPVWILENVSLVETEGAEIPAIQGTSIDITERKRAEDLLRTSEAQLSNAMQIAQLGYWEYDVAKDLFTFNDHFYAIFRTSADRVGGYTMTSARYAELFVHPDDQWMVGQEIQKALETTDPRYSRQLEHRIIYADGQTGYITVRYFVERDDQGRTVKTYGANQDITGRKRAEEALREGEERYRTYVENAPDGIFITDSDARYIDANRAACRMTGYSRDELLDMSIMQLGSSGASPESFEELKKNGRAHSEIVIRRKDGSLMYASLDAVALSDGRYMAFCSDITERKQAEEALRESQERYRTLFEKTANPILVIDDGGNYIDGNQAALDFLEWTRDELLSRNIRDTIPPGRERQTLDAHLSLWENGGVIETDYYVREAVKILELTITPARWRDRRVIFGVGKDITERRRAEENLKEAYDIINRSPTVAFLWRNDEKWSVEFVSNNVKELFGYTTEEFISGGVSYTSLVHPDDLARVAGEVDDYSREEGREDFVHRPYRIVTKGGEVKWIDDRTHIRRDEDGRITHYQGVVEDITERKAAEEALRESEKRIRTLADASFEAIMIHEDGTLLQANDQFFKMFGYGRDELLGRNVIPLLIAPESVDLIRSKIVSGSTEIYEVVVIKKDGTTFPAEIQGRPVEYHARRVRVASMRDLSGRKKMEAQLIQAERLAAVGTLAYGIAHEFNNIVAGILGNAEFGMGNDDRQEVEECFRVIMENCDRARSITNHLLAFAVRREVKKEASDLADAMESVLGLMERELQKENIQVERDFHPVSEIFCDPGELSEVFLNMITNARDAMRPDGGTLTIGMNQTGGDLLITFADTGCGIPDEIKGRIFEPFVTTKGPLGQSEIPGTGLGLFLSIGVISGYHGKIEVQSRKGKGSTFTLRIPISENQTPPGGIEDQLEKTKFVPRSLRILLVDDEEPICTATKNGLEADGHSVVSTTSGKKGLELFRSGAFDLVLSDITMPDMDGIALISSFRSVDPRVKLVVLTGHIQGDKLAAAKKAGADQILIKPFKKEDLLRTMNRVLASDD